MTWVERILATPCPHPSCKAPAKFPCGTNDKTGWFVCASRIAAAEGAAVEVAPGKRHRFMHRPGEGTWGYNRYRCVCGAWRTYNGTEQVYSTDDGATWTPGPDACPGRRP